MDFENENEVAVALTDILFECPLCGKSMVIDEVAEGMVVECPKCAAKVIVPPRPVLPFNRE